MIRNEDSVVSHLKTKKGRSIVLLSLVILFCAFFIGANFDNIDDNTTETTISNKVIIEENGNYTETIDLVKEIDGDYSFIEPTTEEETTEKVETTEVVTTEKVVETTKKVVETTKKETTTRQVEANNDRTDLQLLTYAIYREAGSDWCSDTMQLYVGNVILNRVADTKYFGKYNTIQSVLTQPGQYAFVSNGYIPEPSESLKNSSAYKRCEKNAQLLLDGNRYLPENVLFQAEFMQGDGLYEKVQNMYFCYKN